MAGIVKTSAAAPRNWGVNDFTVGTSSVQIAGADVARRSVTIINDADSASDVYLLPDHGNRGGLRLAPGAGWTQEAAAPIYAYCRTGSALVYIVSQSGEVCD